MSLLIAEHFGIQQFVFFALPINLHNPHSLHNINKYIL
jgi:hypothetical protein